MKFLQLAVFSIVLSSLLEAETLTLQLDEAVDRGLRHNLSLKKSAVDLDVAAMRANKLWAHIFPSVSLGGGVSYGNPLFTEKTGERPLDFSAAVSLSLGFNGGLPAAMRNITLAYETQLLSYEDARRQLELQISKDFFNLKAEQENLRLLEDAKRLAEAQLTKNEVAFNNGFIGETEYLRSRLAAEGEKLNLSRAGSLYATNREKFLTLLGIGEKEAVELEGVMEIFEINLDAEKLITGNLLKRPDIVFQHKRIESLKNTKKESSWKNRGPSLNLEGEWRASLADPFSDNLSASVTLGIPLDPWIPGSVKDQEIYAADSEIKKAYLDLEDLENTGRTDIRSRAALINSSWATIQTARLRVETARRAYALSEEGFQMGTVESVDLETVRKDMVEARQELLNEELLYRNMILDLAAAVNLDWSELVRDYRRL